MYGALSPLDRHDTDIFLQNVKLRIASLPPPRGSPAYDLTISSAPQAPTLVIPQLTSVRTSINSCLDVIDVAVWGGDDTKADFVAGQLQLLHEHIQEARQALKGYSDVHLPWWEHPVDEKVRQLGSHWQVDADGCDRPLTLHCLQPSPSIFLSSMPPLSSKSAPSSLSRPSKSRSQASASATA